MDKAMLKTYWLVLLSPESEMIAEDMIRPYIGRGFKIHNIVIFTTSASIDEIHTHIKEVRPENFIYLLSDMTNNLTKDTFKAIIDNKYYRYSDLLSKYIKTFRTEESPETSLSEPERFNLILDKINRLGMDKLPAVDKEWLDKYSKK